MNDDLWIFVYNFTQLPWHLQSVWHRIGVHIQADLDIFWYYCLCIYHYCEAIMGTIASEITSLTIVYTTVYSDADQSKHQSSASLAFVWGIHRDRWIPRTKGQLRGKCFHLMTSSCIYMGKHETTWCHFFDLRHWIINLSCLAMYSVSSTWSIK